MIKGAPLICLLGVASLSLLLAVGVYCFARIYPPELLLSFQVIKISPAANAEIFGSAPSFFYTLAIVLFIGTCTSTLAGARLHSLLWIGVAVCLEVSQNPVISESTTTWLAGLLPVSIWEIFAPYWVRGVFDPWDLFATIFGGLIALAMITHFPTEPDDERCS